MQNICTFEASKANSRSFSAPEPLVAIRANIHVEHSRGRRREAAVAGGCFVRRRLQTPHKVTTALMTANVRIRSSEGLRGSFVASAAFTRMKAKTQMMLNVEIITLVCRKKR